jgi:hypothetical protein
MTVQELIDALKGLPAGAPVKLGVAWPEGITEMYENLWVAESTGSAQIMASMDWRGVHVHVGCAMARPVRKPPPQPQLHLGHYDSPETAARVRDFYVVHKGLDEPLNFPDFDYQDWIPPRTTEGEYNEHIAKILEEKLLDD